MEQLKIYITESYLAAYKLFRLFESQITDNEAEGIHFQVFSNCREQGIVLRHYETYKMVILCHQRNGDSLLVYYGLFQQFDIGTNLPDAVEVWEQNKIFKSNDYEGAAAFIKEWLFTKEAQQSINTYCFRAEREYDVDELRKLISLRINKLTKEIKYPSYVTEVEIETDLSLEQLQDEMRKVKHGSLMVHTVDHKDQYTGKVKNIGGKYLTGDPLSRTSTHWLEGGGL